MKGFDGSVSDWLACGRSHLANVCDQGRQRMTEYLWEGEHCSRLPEQMYIHEHVKIVLFISSLSLWDMGHVNSQLGSKLLQI